MMIYVAAGQSSNLMIAGIAGKRGVDMGMLSFAAVALPVALVGAGVIYLTSPRGHRIDPHACRASHRHRHGVDPVTAVALIGTCVLHAHKPVQPPAEGEGHAARRLHGSAVRPLGARILPACLVTVCGVAYLLLSS